MAAENLAIYHSARNALISTKFSGMISVVILSHFELSESRSHDLVAILDFFLKMPLLATLKGCGLLLLHFLQLYVPLEYCMPLEHSFLP